jgi:hypothetical protein
LNDGSLLTNYYERRGNIAAFSSISIFRDGCEVVGGSGPAQQEETLRVSPEFFTTLGVGLAMGRSERCTAFCSTCRHCTSLLFSALRS